MSRFANCLTFCSDDIYFQGVQDDIAIHDFQKAMTVSDNEYEDYTVTELSQPPSSDVVHGDYKSVEVDESTGGGLVSSIN